MRRVGTADEVQAFETRLIDELGVPGLALMELAAKALAEQIMLHHPVAARRGVLVVCGGGNNGGDGFACARWLFGWGVPVSVFALSKRSKGEARVTRASCVSLGVPFVSSVCDAGLIVDAVLGVGLNRPVKSGVKVVIDAINGHPAPVLSVDVPSGICANTGAILGAAVRAQTTVTFGFLKLGLCSEPASDWVGRRVVVDLGFAAIDQRCSAQAPEKSDLAPLWPRRSPGDYKTRLGHLIIVAGSLEMAGAAILSARGALASGVGLVTLWSSEATLSRLGSLPPEVMFRRCGVDQFEAPSLSEVQADALVVGPGLGGGRALDASSHEWLRQLWARFEGALVYDADALSDADGEGAGQRLITPHPGEAARLLGCSAAKIQANRFAAASSLAVNRVVLLKGRNTVVAAPGRPLSINLVGSPVLATGGSGDVLSGLLGGLMARGLSAWDSARLGAWVHGRAGELLERRRADGRGASAVAKQLPCAIDDLIATPASDFLEARV